ILGYLVMNDADEIESKAALLTGVERLAFLDELSQRAALPYGIFALVPLILIFVLRKLDLPEIVIEEETRSLTDDHRGIVHFPHLILGVIALFLYVGAEVIAGDTIGNFGQAQGISLANA